MLATKMNSTTPINNNRNSTFFWRAPVQGHTPTAGNSGGINSFPMPPPVLPSLTPNSLPSSSSNSRRSGHNNTTRAWANPYQALTAGGRKKIQKRRQKMTREAQEDNSAIPSFLKILNVPPKKQKMARIYAEALQRKARKLKEKAMRQNKYAPRALYRGPKLNWMEIQALNREEDEKNGKRVDAVGETGVSNINEILQQTCPISNHVPQVVMPGAQKGSEGEVNDGDTDPGTDSDDEGDDVGVEDENKENVNVNPGGGASQVQSPIVSLPGRTAEPKTPINTCRPSAHRATVEEVDDDEQIPKTPISAHTLSSFTEGIFAAPRKPSDRGEQVFPDVQSWDDRKPMESGTGHPSNTTSHTFQSSSETNVPNSTWWDQQQTSLPEPRSSFPSGDGSYASQKQRSVGASLDAVSGSNAQQTPQSHQSYFTGSTQPTNLQKSCFSFPATRPSYLHSPSGADVQPAAASQPMSQPGFPLPNAQPSMLQTFSNSTPEVPQQPQTFIPNTRFGFQQGATFNLTSQQPATYSASSFYSPFQNNSFQPQNISSQQSTTTAFPTLEATSTFFSTSQRPPAASRPIIRRLPVLAPDEPLNRSVLFGPYGIQAFLKEKPIPVEGAPPPPTSLGNFDCKAWNEKIKRRSKEFQARRNRSGPLGKFPPSPKNNYVGNPPRGSEQDLIRRLELERKYEKKTKKRVRFLLPDEVPTPDEAPRKKRRIEESAKEITLTPAIVIVPEKPQLSASQTVAEADPVVPGAYDIKWDDGHVVKWENPRQCPDVTGLFSFLFGNLAGCAQNKECQV